MLLLSGKQFFLKLSNLLTAFKLFGMLLTVFLVYIILVIFKKNYCYKNLSENKNTFL